MIFVASYLARSLYYQVRLAEVVQELEIVHFSQQELEGS